MTTVSVWKSFGVSKSRIAVAWIRSDVTSDAPTGSPTRSLANMTFRISETQLATPQGIFEPTDESSESHSRGRAGIQLMDVHRFSA